MREKLNIGLFGLGVVGTGLYEVLNKANLLDAQISSIVVKDKGKKRSTGVELISYEKSDILDDANINVVVELIDDADAAYTIVREAIQSRKHVVSANKKMIARHLEELILLAKKNEVSFLYEAAVAGSIPVIRNLEEYYNNDTLRSLEGIVNGTTNYILTQTSKGKNYKEALFDAQEKGFAESDPTSDVDGHDSKFKLKILLKHAFGCNVMAQELFQTGIRNLKEQDLEFAKEKEFRVKLFARAEKRENSIIAFVAPHFVKPDHFSYNVENEFNAVVLEGGFSDKQLFIGKGAGAYPTASAVLSDISALQYGYKYEYKKTKNSSNLVLEKDFFIKIYLGSEFVELINEVPFYRIDEVFQGANYCYQTGWVRFSEICNFDFNKQKALSLIILPESPKTKEEIIDLQTERRFAVEL